MTDILFPDGYPEDLFVNFDTLPSKLKCPICFLIIKDACFHLYCQNGFCRDCVAGLESCPCCRKSLKTGLYVDITRKELIRELEVCCPNEEVSCRWTGTLERLGNHVTDCLQDYSLKICKYCDKEVLSKDLSAHENQCADSVRPCLLCNVPVQSTKLKDHLQKDCSRLSVPCPNTGCGKLLLLKELSVHVKECSHNRVSCSYQHLGCTKKGSASEMGSHYQSCMFATRHPLFKRCKQLETMVVQFRDKMLETSSSIADLSISLSEDSILDSNEQTQLFCQPLNMTSIDSPTERTAISSGNVGSLNWKIQNFPSRMERFIESPSFPDSNGDIWTCRLYPYGDGNTNGFLTFGAYKSSDSPAKYNAQIVNKTSCELSVIRSVASTDTRWRSAGWGWRRFIRRERLLKQGFLSIEGTLTIVVEANPVDV